jgi:hypothetical protein
MLLPDILKHSFWDYDFQILSWAEHRDFIIRRLLQAGDWQALTWLRGAMGDDELGRWIEQHNGVGLSPRQLRFWELALGLPQPKVNQWVIQARSAPWGQRTNP